MGDYIDRGPDSREVIDYLLDIEQRVKHTVFLLGNHEHLLLRYAHGGDPEDLRLLRLLGVEQTLDSYGHSHVLTLRDLSFLPESHRLFLERLSGEYRAGGFLFVHAGVLHGDDAGECSLEARLNVRQTFFDREGPSGTIVVFGHTPFETPFLTPDKIGIDTGAVYGNLLTAVELPALRFHHA